MSGCVADRKRLIRVTGGNLRVGHLYVTGHYDFFPDDVIGSNLKSSPGVPVQIELVGMNTTISTDIATEKDGTPRRHFRAIKPFREFYRHHEIQPGDVLALEKLGKRRYRLYTFDTAKRRCSDWNRWVFEPIEGPTVLDLFAGCGGMSLGFKQAGFHSALAVEWDKAACDTLRINITERIAQCAVEEIDKFPAADVVIGGPPCQGFSNLGERLPADPRRQMWRHFMRAVADAQPAAFVMENVPPLLKSQEYVELVRSAERLGYRVGGWILNAADFGVPQARKRAIVIGLRDGDPAIPPPTHGNPKNQPETLSHWELPNWNTVRKAIGDLPLVPSGTDWHIGRNPTALSLARYRSIPPGGNRFDLPLDLTPDCWIRKKSGGTDLMGRLWWDRPSVTIRTEFYKPEKGRYLHPEADRPITHREAMRLQGFPDDFIFCGSKIQVARQVGNAVPPPLAKAIALEIASAIRLYQAST